MKKILISGMFLMSVSVQVHSKINCIGEICMTAPINGGIYIPHVSSSHGSYDSQRAMIELQRHISDVNELNQVYKLYSRPDVWKRNPETLLQVLRK